ncbi:response regulator, partial [Mastigocoleus testarum]|uniref:Transcriptional regulator n=1 Tax=Mastigocoleus testarum BC008 TaxID=371196 RepID=A0A0V7ZNY4_9CYAN
MRILIVEDDELISEPIVKALREKHYTVDVTEDGEKGWELANALTYDLIVLDVMLPKLDGITLIRQARSQNILSPIILLTSQESSTNKVIGLDAGADDYITKPFDLQEFLARVRALLRRRNNSVLPPLLKWGSLNLDPSICQVSYENKLLPLTPKEYSLLELFLRNSHRTFTLDAIVEQLWSFEEAPGDNTIRAHIKGLRMKLKKAGVTEDPVETVYGIGYRLRQIGKIDPQENKLKQKNHKTSKKNISPQQDSSEVEQKLRSITTNAWIKKKEKLKNLVLPIEQATILLLQGEFDNELFSLAYQNAHKLTGNLGMFGLNHGSYLAHQIETLIAARVNFTQKQKLQLSELVKSLYQELEQGISHQHFNLPESNLPENDQRPLILIVDRDERLIEELCDSIKTWGMRYEIAINPEFARKLISRQTPDAVILDITGGNNGEGLKLLAEVNSHVPKIPVLALTSEDNLLERVQVARLGGKAFLQKPADTKLVLETITNILQLKREYKAKVLIVDDDPDILYLLSSLLQNRGFEVSTLDNPLNFWENLQAMHPDVLIFDVEMPSLSGIELCQVVRNDPRTSSLLVFFITAHTDLETIQQVLAAGADDYLSKPIIGSELVTRIFQRLER